MAEYVVLNDGRRMPMVGLGTFQADLECVDKSVKYTSAVVPIVKSALEVGYRHIDTAALYNTEDDIGQALKECIQNKLVTRDDVYITTKLWCNSHGRNDVVPALRKSLAAFQLDYVDMYLVHFPLAFQRGEEFWPRHENGNLIPADHVTITETWEGMIECQKLGLAKSIGVSNFNERQLQTLFDTTSVKPANNQVEVHPLFQNQKLVEFCKKNGVQVTCYAPLGRPERTWVKPGDPEVATDPVLNAIGRMHNKTAAQVALRFQIQRGLPVLPKCNSVGHQRENLAIFDFELSTEEMQEIMTKCDRNFRVWTFQVLFGDSTFKEELY